MHSSTLVSVGNAFLDRALDEHHVLVQVMRVPRAQDLIDKLAAVASNLFGLVVHARADERHESMRVGVFEYDANGRDARRGHDFRRVRY